MVFCSQAVSRLRLVTSTSLLARLRSDQAKIPPPVTTTKDNQEGE